MLLVRVFCVRSALTPKGILVRSHFRTHMCLSLNGLGMSVASLAKPGLDANSMSRVNSIVGQLDTQLYGCVGCLTVRVIRKRLRSMTQHGLFF